MSKEKFWSRIFIILAIPAMILGVLLLMPQVRDALLSSFYAEEGIDTQAAVLAYRTARMWLNVITFIDWAVLVGVVIAEINYFIESRRPVYAMFTVLEAPPVKDDLRDGR